MPDTPRGSAAPFTVINEIEHALLTLWADPRDVPKVYGWRHVAHLADEAARSAVAEWLREQAKTFERNAFAVGTIEALAQELEEGLSDA